MPIDLSAAEDVSPTEAPVSNVSEISEISEVLEIPAIPKRISLFGAPFVRPRPAPVDDKLGPLPKAGVQLTKWLLVIISIFLVISLIWIWRSDVEYSRWLRPDHLKEFLNQFNVPAQKDSVAQMILKDHADFRDFWLKFLQLVLLNVLLPVLTAILGYTFASGKSSEKEPEKEPEKESEKKT